jgi:glycolate oxidase iron-sulfur subunit
VQWVTEHPPQGQSLCVQCGLCLPACPTFRLTGREDYSPRGRLSAILAVDNGLPESGVNLESVLDTCLGCRACEPACPSAVPYGQILERARAEIAAQVPGARRRFRHWAVGRAITNPTLLGFATRGAALIQRFNLSSLLPKPLQQPFGGLRLLSFGSNSLPLPPSGEPTLGEVALLKGCVMNAWFTDVHIATIGVLQAAGYRVVIPPKQTCCGALAAHEGNADDAHRLAQENQLAFANAGAIVINAAGCSAHMADYDEWLGDGGAFSSKVVDVVSLVATAIENGDLPRLDIRSDRVGVQDPCHHRHGQGIISEPRIILDAAGFEVVEIDSSGTCCGAAGMYSVRQPSLSRELGEAKARQVEESDVSVVSSANPGCEMQLRSYCREEIEIRHPIELYWDALSSGTT